MLASTWHQELKIPDESNSASDVPGYFNYITKNYEALTDNHPIRIYVKTETRITFKIKTGYCF